MKDATMSDVLVSVLIPAMVAGCALAAMCGPLGCVIVWRRMAYFGDALAHAALLGVAVALVCDALPIPVAILCVCVLAALVLPLLLRDQRIHADTALGMIAHSALALGIVLITMVGDGSMELESYLIGDILALNGMHVVVICAVALVVVITIGAYWRRILMVVLEPATAQLHSVAVSRIEIGFVVILAVLVAMSVQLVGVLLLTSMLIIPAAAAGNIARSPGRMAIIASAIGMVAVVAGLMASVRLDTPPAPTMVVVASIIYVFMRVCKRAV
jgi:zinc transport system permease protein